MEIQIIFIWYLFSLLIGIVGLPITSKLFSKFPDKGYGLARTIGLVALAIPIWFLSSLKIINFQTFPLFIPLVIAVILSFIYLKKSNFKVTKLMILEELIFLVIFIIWAVVRSTNAKIEGTEKMMNIAFMNSINRTDFFPPQDPWFSQGTINYYYIGHYLFTFFGKLTNIPLNFGYNLSLNTIIAMGFTSLISIFTGVFNPQRRKLSLAVALIGAFFICFGGNLHYIYTIFSQFIAGGEINYFFPDATRIISYTINEFPAYSVVLGDLHGHYLSIPFFLFAIALAIVSFNIPVFSYRKIYFTLGISAFIFMLYTINSWDFITINVLFFLLHGYQLLNEKKKLSAYFKNLKIKNKNIKEIILRVFYLVFLELLIIMVGLVLFLPYMINFFPPVGGIGLVPFEVKSELLPWLLFWGVHLIVLIIFIYSLLKLKIEIIKKDHIFLIFLLLSGGLIFGVEFVFLKDLFFEVNYNYFRTNTVFKFYYHAWMIFGIVTVYFTYRIMANFSLFRLTTKNFIFTLFTFIFFCSAVYMYKAVNDFYNLNQLERSTLDGINYINIQNHSDYEVINWINQNIDDQPIILEAVGEAYTYSSRISAYTGLPTVIGWPSHEWQWRKNIDEIDFRKQDVQTLYETNSIQEAQYLIEKYAVEYIFIGKFERSKYKAINETFIQQYSDVAFEALDENKLYKINKEKLYSSL